MAAPTITAIRATGMRGTRISTSMKAHMKRPSQSWWPT